MIPIQFKIYALIAILLLAGGVYANYRYQKYTIEQLETKLAISTSKAESLESNVNTIQSTIETFKENQVQTKKDTDKLKSSISRLDVIKSKPGLVSIKIEKSYKNFHLEKACYSGNKEACDAIKTK